MGADILANIEVVTGKVNEVDSISPFPIHYRFVPRFNSVGSLTVRINIVRINIVRINIDRVDIDRINIDRVDIDRIHEDGSTSLSCINCHSVTISQSGSDSRKIRP